MNPSAWILLIGTCGVLAASPASAADTGFYLSAGGGRAEEDPGKSAGINISIGFPAAGVIHLEPDRVTVDSGDTAWSIGAGYRFSRYVAAEVEYLDLGTTDITEYYSYDLGPIINFPPRQYSSSLSGPAISILGLIPLGEKFDVFLRAGAWFADRKLEVTQYADAGSNTFGDTVWLGGAGLDWSFASHWAIRAEYALTGDLEQSIFAGETAAESVSLRLRYAF